MLTVARRDLDRGPSPTSAPMGIAVEPTGAVRVVWPSARVDAAGPVAVVLTGG